MKKAILVLVVLAVAGILAYKFIGSSQPNVTEQSQTATITPNSNTLSTNPATQQTKSTFYLFHDPSDQDEGCRVIYAFADRAESELASRVEVKRPDVKADKATMDKFKVRVLPTILLVAPDGQVTERFEGEDGKTIKQLGEMIARLKTAQ